MRFELHPLSGSISLMEINVYVPSTYVVMSSLHVVTYQKRKLMKIYRNNSHKWLFVRVFSLSFLC